MLNEITKPIEGYEGIYSVSSAGYVSNGRKILKTYTTNSGYSALKLQRDGVSTSFLLHRLVAQAFIPNPDNKPEVNHRDGVKSNCAVDNLEWATRSENKLHALTTGLKVYNKPSTGKKLGKQSQYHNVTWDVSRKKWVSTVRHNSKNHGCKRFDKESDAALHVNKILDELGLTDRPRNVIL